jgi:hypothetical protein
MNPVAAQHHACNKPASSIRQLPAKRAGPLNRIEATALAQQLWGFREQIATFATLKKINIHHKSFS